MLKHCWRRWHSHAQNAVPWPPIPSKSLVLASKLCISGQLPLPFSIVMSTFNIPLKPFPFSPPLAWPNFLLCPGLRGFPYEMWDIQCKTWLPSYPLAHHQLISLPIPITQKRKIKIIRCDLPQVFLPLSSTWIYISGQTLPSVLEARLSHCWLRAQFPTVMTHLPIISHLFSATFLPLSPHTNMCKSFPSSKLHILHLNAFPFFDNPTPCLSFTINFYEGIIDKHYSSFKCIT